MENNLLEQAIKELKVLQENTPEGNHIRTSEIRKLSGRLFRKIEDKEIKNVFDLCEEFLGQHTWELGIIAFDWAFRMKKSYSRDTYHIFYSWLKKYVRGWGDCDDFCTHAFGELLRQEKSLFEHILDWTQDPDFWVRRASAVILIPAILHNDFNGIDPLSISDRLMNDEHELVLKGYGWMLKSLSQIDQSVVEKYLLENYKQMPRIAYRYAIEKFDNDTKKKFMML